MEKYDSSVLKDLNAYIDDFIAKTSEKSKGIIVLEDKLKHINHTIVYLNLLIIRIYYQLQLNSMILAGFHNIKY